MLLINSQTYNIFECEFDYKFMCSTSNTDMYDKLKRLYMRLRHVDFAKLDNLIQNYADKKCTVIQCKCNYELTHAEALDLVKNDKEYIDCGLCAAHITITIDNRVAMMTWSNSLFKATVEMFAVDNEYTDEMVNMLITMYKRVDNKCTLGNERYNCLEKWLCMARDRAKMRSLLIYRNTLANLSSRPAIIARYNTRDPGWKRLRGMYTQFNLQLNFKLIDRAIGRPKKNREGECGACQMEGKVVTLSCKCVLCDECAINFLWVIEITPKCLICRAHILNEDKLMLLTTSVPFYRVMIYRLMVDVYYDTPDSKQMVAAMITKFCTKHTHCC